MRVLIDDKKEHVTLSRITAREFLCLTEQIRYGLKHPCPLVRDTAKDLCVSCRWELDWKARMVTLEYLDWDEVRFIYAMCDRAVHGGNAPILAGVLEAIDVATEAAGRSHILLGLEL